MNVSEKLKLIKEGYSLDDIHSGSINTEPIFIFESDSDIFFESINSDIKFITEASVNYIYESSLDSMKERISKFIQWIVNKITVLTTWIKNKVQEQFRKNDLKVIQEFKKKLNSGAVEKYIKDHSETEIQLYKNVVYNPTPPNLYKQAEKLVEIVEKALNNFRGSENKLKIDSKSSEFAKNVSEKDNMLQGITNKDLNSQEEIYKEIMRIITNQGIDSKEDIYSTIFGGLIKFKLKNLNAHVISNTLKVVEENDSYEILSVCEYYIKGVQKWKDVANSILSDTQTLKEYDSKVVTKIQRNVGQFMNILSAIGEVLSDLAIAQERLSRNCMQLIRELNKA